MSLFSVLYFQFLTPRSLSYCALRAIQTSSVPQKVNKVHIRAGRHRPTANRRLALTYEEAKPPHLVGVDKSWNSWNTSEEIYGIGTVLYDTVRFVVGHIKPFNQIFL